MGEEIKMAKKITDAYYKKNKDYMRSYDGALGYEAIYNAKTGEFWDDYGGGIDKNAFNDKTQNSKKIYAKKEKINGEEKLIFY